MAEKSAAQAGLTANEQVRIALNTMVANGGTATTNDIYAAVEARMAPDTLSQQGRATLRAYINRDAVRAGFIEDHVKGAAGWTITPEGREFIQAAPPAAADVEQVTDAAGAEVNVPSVTVRALAFEKHILSLMRAVYPEYAWYHQGVHKQHERGVDILGTRLRREPGIGDVIGVQVKLHSPDNAPALVEWLKFLAGCYARRVGQGVFVTTGRLTGEQRREAAEAGVTVIEGREEVARVCKAHGIADFFADEAPHANK